MALTARVAASERGQRTSFNSLRADDRVSAYERNGARGSRDIEGKAARVAASECGQRASFNGAVGISDMAGKAARVAVEPSESERDTNSFHGKPREIGAERR
jgi:hypothetical protein